MPYVWATHVCIVSGAYDSYHTSGRPVATRRGTKVRLILGSGIIVPYQYYRYQYMSIVQWIRLLPYHVRIMRLARRVSLWQLKGGTYCILLAPSQRRRAYRSHQDTARQYAIEYFQGVDVIIICICIVINIEIISKSLDRNLVFYNSNAFNCQQLFTVFLACLCLVLSRITFTQQPTTFTIHHTPYTLHYTLP